jgi:hypothetical protein
MNDVQALIKSIEALVNTMDSMKEIPNIVASVQAQQQLITYQIGELTKITCRHESILSGDPEHPGESGVIAEVKTNKTELLEVKKEVKHIKGRMAAIYAGVITTINATVGYFLNRSH